MPRRGGIRWFYDTLRPSLRAFPLVVNGRIEARLEEQARMIEDYMKQNAPWSDQSGDARDGLAAESEARLFRHTIYLYHTVDYGIWLEVRWSGQYAIIVPTIEAMGPHTMASLKGVASGRIL